MTNRDFALLKTVISNEFWKFSFLITWRSPSSKSAAVYKISWKSDDFSLRYGDISIFKMVAVRHLGIVIPPYETTHELSLCCWPQLPVKFHANLIHRSEDLAIWIFRTFGLKCLFIGPQNGVLEDFGPLNVIIHHRDPQKAHPCVNPRLLSYQL